MTSAELEEIRGRALLRHYATDAHACFEVLLSDRASLLAEVDRLNAILARIADGLATTARHDHSQCLIALAAIERLVAPRE